MSDRGRRLGTPRSRAAVVVSVACFVSAGLTSAAAAQQLSPDPSASPVHTAAPATSPLVSTPAVTIAEVEAFDLGFTPTSLEVPATGTSRIVLHNAGFVAHNLTVDALGIQVVAARGLTSEATITDPASGTYEFYCSVSGHKQAGMIGTLVVQGSAPADPTGAPSPAVVSEGATASG